MYKIIIRTDLYNAKRNVGFNPNTGIKILEENLTLKEAQKSLLNHFNEANDTNYNNWGLVVANTKKKFDCAISFSDGTRCFEYDIFKYIIVEMEEEF